MHWYGYVVTKCMVIKQVDQEKQNNVDDPTSDRYPVGLQEEWRVSSVELRWVARDGYKHELDKCQESTCHRSDANRGTSHQRAYRWQVRGFAVSTKLSWRTLHKSDGLPT